MVRRLLCATDEGFLTQPNISQIETNEVSGIPFLPQHTLPAFTFHLFMSIAVYQISLDQHNLHNRPRIAHFSPPKNWALRDVKGRRFHLLPEIVA